MSKSIADTRSAATHGSKRIFTGEIADRPLLTATAQKTCRSLGRRAHVCCHRSSDLLRLMSSYNPLCASAGPSPFPW